MRVILIIIMSNIQFLDNTLYQIYNDILLKLLNICENNIECNIEKVKISSNLIQYL